MKRSVQDCATQRPWAAEEEGSWGQFALSSVAVAVAPAAAAPAPGTLGSALVSAALFFSTLGENVFRVCCVSL